MICQCLTAPDIAGWVEEIREQREYAILYELRFDLLADLKTGSPAAIGRLLDRVSTEVLPELSGKPWIAVVRRGEDLGGWPVSDECARIEVLRSILQRLEPRYIELELGFTDETVTGFAGAHGTTIVRSFHDFAGTPEELDRVFDETGARTDEIAKLVVTPQSAADLLRLYETATRFRRKTGKRYIVTGTGEYGLPSVVAPALFGSEWTYAFTGDPGSGGDPGGTERAAPGRYTPKELAETYRAGRAQPEWPLFAVLGAPVAHSRSPEYHNRRFREEGIEALYVPIRADSFAEFEALAEALSIRGVSVTVPHKEAALAAAGTRVSKSARGVGAANTLVRILPRGWRADNTDVAGFLSAIDTEKLDTALVIGAGGAARAIVSALTGVGIDVYIANRTPERALALARHFGLGETRVRSLDGPFDDLHPDIVVQTTSVGMEPNPDRDPLPNYRFAGTEVVYDIIYTPEETLFLHRAGCAGCRVITGRKMFDSQAEAQFVQYRKESGITGASRLKRFG